MSALQVERFDSSTGAVVYRLPLEVFRDYIGYAFVVIHEGRSTLIDAGSGYGSSHQDLLKGFESLRSDFGLKIGLDSLDQILITHGHIDHFGGLSLVKDAAPQARVVCHPLARPVLVSFDERRLLTSMAMRDFLHMAGVPAERRERLLQMHALGKGAFRPVQVDQVIQHGDLLDGLMQVTHVPGHEAGLVMLQLGDLLIVSDHILPDTSVAIAPESITPYTGISHYLDSLTIALKVTGVRMALGGHERSMPDYVEVVERTLQASLQKIDLVHEHCTEPHSIYEIAERVYGPLDGYGELLKLEQTGARIEYLSQRGLVRIENLEDLETTHAPTLRYRRV